MRRSAMAFAATVAAGGVAAADGFAVRSEYAAQNSLVTVGKATSGSVVQGPSSDFQRLLMQGRASGIAGPGGASVAADISVAASRASVLANGARVLSRFAGPAGAALLAYDIYQQFRIRGKGDGSSLEQDPGMPQVEEQGWVYKGAYTQDGWRAWGPWVQAELAARNAIVGNCVHPSTGNTSPAAPWSIVSQSMGDGFTIRQHACPGYQGQAVANVGVLYRDLQQSKFCPATANHPKGYWSPGVDEKCPTEEYSTPLTPAEASHFAEQFAAMASRPIDTANMMREAIGFAEGDIGADAIIDAPVAGVAPQSIPGSASTTTNADGSTTTTQTTYEPAQALTSGTPYGITLPWKERKTTTTRDPQGNVTGTTTTTNTPAPSNGPTTGTGTGNQPNSEPPPDPCVANPERIGCSKYGTVENLELQTEQRSVTFVPDTGWGADDAACPAPKVVQFMGKAIKIENAPVCTFFSALRYVVIAVASIAGAALFIQGTKE